MLSKPPFLPSSEDNRRQHRQQRGEAALMEAVLHCFRLVEASGNEITVLSQQLQRITSPLFADQEFHPALADADPAEVVKHYMSMAYLIAAYALTLLLIYAGTEYLVGLMARGNLLLALVGMVVVPIALLILQITVAIDLYLAKKENSPTLAIKQQIARVLVLVSPTMILATFLAESQGQELWLAGILLLVVRLLLAFITDAWVVYNGERIYLAKIFFLFTFVQARRRKEQEKVEHALHAKSAVLVQSSQDLHQQLSRLRADFPDEEINLPEFSNNTKWALESLMTSRIKQA